VSHSQSSKYQVLSIGGIVGIVIAACAIMVIIVTACLIVRRRGNQLRRAKRETERMSRFSSRTTAELLDTERERKLTPPEPMRVEVVNHNVIHLVTTDPNAVAFVQGPDGVPQLISAVPAGGPQAIGNGDQYSVSTRTSVQEVMSEEYLTQTQYANTPASLLQSTAPPAEENPGTNSGFYSENPFASRSSWWSKS
jgi:hypothetical protein